MENFYNIDDFLAKWASGELSEEEKEAFRKTEDYRYYQAILEGTDVLEVPSHDKEKLFEGVQEKIAKDRKKVRTIPRWTYAMAASIALLIGYFVFFDQTVDHTTGFGERLQITLPDNSSVTLNAKSKLEYKKSGWEKERYLFLKGEAYFKVAKGPTFVVASDYGSVTVLGTQFTVNAEAQIFEVVCFEGSVRVEKGKRSYTIKEGEAVRYANGAFENWRPGTNSPQWTQGESSFNNAPLHQVITALEKQFNVSINSERVNETTRFTGSFTHAELRKALTIVFDPLEIKFTFINENTIVLAEK
ncbi:FecR family protein [Spongiimicrobium sp. 2-473A-2-J]|uniref:FecR family protein n=1 Tax=Eudoraea algarum TaxID=3417568 RepID=UPI003D36B490